MDRYLFSSKHCHISSTMPRIQRLLKSIRHLIPFDAPHPILLLSHFLCSWHAQHFPPRGVVTCMTIVPNSAFEILLVCLLVLVVFMYRPVPQIHSLLLEIKANITNMYLQRFSYANFKSCHFELHVWILTLEIHTRICNIRLW